MRGLSELEAHLKDGDDDIHDISEKVPWGANHALRSQNRSTRRLPMSWIYGGTTSLMLIFIWISFRTWHFPKQCVQTESAFVQVRRRGESQPDLQTRRASGYRGAVASEEERCSKIGIDVLKENGTATDAAIATALCIGVVNCFSSGIGGGGFMVIKPAPCRGRSNCTEQGPITIDFRETIPEGSYYSKRFLEDPILSQVGGLAVGVPGEIAGFQAAYLEYGGGVSWQRLFEPSVQLAKNFTIGTELVKRMYHDGNTDHTKWMKTKTTWREVFFPHGRDKAKSGDYIQRTNYARTLETIGRVGAHAFYRGEIAKQLVETINQAGGRMKVDNFEGYRAIIQPALRTTYLNRTLWTSAAPSSGPMLIYLLNILENYQFKNHSRTALSEHRFIEAMKYTFAARTKLADPHYLNETELALIKSFQSKDIARETYHKIDDSRTYNYQHYNPEYDIINDHGTTHLSVVDQSGSAVSLTSTVNLVFGSQLMDPNNGIILNNENDDFSVKGRSNYFDLFSSPLNTPEAGKRPVSSIAPTIVDHGQEVWSTLGASGGSRIFTAITGSLLKLDWGYDLQTAIEDPRVHHQLLPNEALIETSYRPDFLSSLKVKGHNITMVDIRHAKSVVQGIVKHPDGLLEAVSDSRKGGIPSAY